MKLKTLLIAACASLAFIACDESTATLGGSITSDMDHLEIATDTFKLSSRSIVVDSVYARNSVSYLGTIRDPETGDYIQANYMTQFHTLENYEFPPLDSIVSRDEKGLVMADSCELRLFFHDFYGDSLTSMKCTAYEMNKPMKENVQYYSNFDPKAEGFISPDGLKKSTVYTLTDLNVPESARHDEDFTNNIRIRLNDAYTDKNGVTYNNYGTYVMRTYYEHPDYFKNSIRLTNNVIPGFYLEATGGIGSMAYVAVTQLNIYFTYNGKSDSVAYTGTTSFAGTNEVMQRTNIINDRPAVQQLANDETCTYLKTPAGIFTELTIPVDEICEGHANDSINTAKFSLQRIINTTDSEYNFPNPTSLLLLPKDSLNSFFENRDIINNKISFLSSYDNSKSIYTFGNISSLINAMHTAKMKGEATEDWNKVVVVPVTTTTNNSGNIVKIVHNMSFTSTRLVGGARNPYDDIKLSVIYSRYK